MLHKAFLADAKKVFRKEAAFLRLVGGSIKRTPVLQAPKPAFWCHANLRPVQKYLKEQIAKGLYNPVF